MWSAHVVHHSSPDYNYSTGFRASFLEHTVSSAGWRLLQFTAWPMTPVAAVVEVP
jgi:sterol desaturase/sphingolipid hydroxylase (fatty acid hydroxylase superfamily)